MRRLFEGSFYLLVENNCCMTVLCTYPYCVCYHENKINYIIVHYSTAVTQRLSMGSLYLAMKKREENLSTIHFRESLDIPKLGVNLGNNPKAS